VVGERVEAVVFSAGREQSMPKDEWYDVVALGGGPNGTGAAAYLAKSGVTVPLDSIGQTLC
jgi:alkyl hydroperoxide reductase subunit AhpF